MHATVPRNVQQTVSLCLIWLSWVHYEDSQSEPYIYLGILVRWITGLHWKKMSGFSEAVNYNPNRIISSWGGRQTNNEVHTNILPFPWRNIQRLKHTGGFEVTRFNSLVDVTLRNIVSYLPLHPCPPEPLFQILIHFITARVDWVPREMSLIKNLFSEFQILRYHQPVLKP